MEIQRLRSLIHEGRYEVDAGLVAEAIVKRLRPPGIEVPWPEPPTPGQLEFDPTQIQPPR